MEEITIKVKLLSEHAVLPVQNEDGVGLDLCAAHDKLVHAGENVLVATDVAWEIPKGHVGLVLQRSGLGATLKLAVLGVIDDTFRGGVSVNCHNSSSGWVWAIQKGHRVAQMLVLPAPRVTIVEGEELSETSRGERGVGSSGR